MKENIVRKYLFVCSLSHSLYKGKQLTHIKQCTKFVDFWRVAKQFNGVCAYVFLTLGPPGNQGPNPLILETLCPALGQKLSTKY